MVPVWQLQQHWAAVGLAHCCGYFGAIVLVFISSILLVCLVIHFYPHMRTLLYREGVCTITDAVYTTQYSCFCGQLGCKSFYPCLIVYVLVNSSLDGLDQRIKEQLRWPVPVYQDDWQQIRVYKSADDTTERCTIYKCNRDREVNRDQVEIFRVRESLIHSSRSCWFDPEDLLGKGAIFHKSVSWTIAFHATFWPGLLLLTGVAVLAGMCFITLRRRKRMSSSSWGRDEIPEDPPPGSTEFLHMEKF